MLFEGYMDDLHRFLYSRAVQSLLQTARLAIPASVGGVVFYWQSVCDKSQLVNSPTAFSVLSFVPLTHTIFGCSNKMRFVDQAWKIIDIDSNNHKKQSDLHENIIKTSLGQPSLHVFTPRMKTLVQCARLKARMTVDELAQLIDTDPQDVIKIEEGKRFPSSKTLESLQKVLKIRLVPDNLLRTQDSAGQTQPKKKRT